MPTKVPVKGNFLTAKVGPLPAYAWGMLAAGAAYLYIKHKQGTAAAATPTTATGGSGFPLSSDFGGFGGDGSGDFSSPVRVVPLRPTQGALAIPLLRLLPIPTLPRLPLR